MPPAPDAAKPLQERLLELVQTLQFAWFAGHLTLILTTFRYGLSWLRMNYYGGMAKFCYSTSFLAASITYGIVVYKTQKARAKTGTNNTSTLSLLADENVQYLLMAVVWFLAPQYPIALLPYAVYSVFHVATYTRANLIPVITPPPPAADASSPRPKINSPLADRIGDFVKAYYDSSMAVVATLEIAIWFRILLSAIIFAPRSWILLTLYTVFLRARYSQSTHVQAAFGALNARVDSLVGAQGTPPAARQFWETLKTGLRQFRDLTDLSNYPPPGHKKTS